jgi:two-component system response regulator RegA
VTGGEAATEEGSMLKILLVDDDESNRLTLSVLLEDEDFHVTTAASRAEAEALVSAQSDYDVVLLDHTLGDGFGTDLIPLLRERIPRAKVVAMSGSSGAEMMLMQADAALPKGMHFPDFLQRLRALVG